MIVFHGSYTEIQKIDLSKAEVAKDFGRGFYVTKIRKDAESMARKQGRDHNCAGVVSGFEFDSDKADLSRFCKTKRFDGYTLEWLNFIIKNRKNKSVSEQTHEFDIVEGPIADDDVAQKVESFSNDVSDAEKESLLKDLKYRYTHQICFCTVRSLDTIKRINLAPYIEVKKIGHSIITLLIKDDNLSKRDAWNLYFESEIYKNVSDENTGLYKKSWQKIYDMLKMEIEAQKMP